MYITIRRFKIDAEVMDEVIDLAKDEFVPELVAIPGFKAFYHLRPAEDRLVSVSVFEDKTGADASNRLSQECVKDHFADLLPEPPEVIEGEVVTQELAEGLISAHWMKGAGVFSDNAPAPCPTSPTPPALRSRTPR